MSVLVRPRPPHPGGVYRIPGEDALAKARASRTPGNLLRVSRSASAGGSTSRWCSGSPPTARRFRSVPGRAASVCSGRRGLSLCLVDRRRPSGWTSGLSPVASSRSSTFALAVADAADQATAPIKVSRSVWRISDLTRFDSAHRSGIRSSLSLGFTSARTVPLRAGSASQLASEVHTPPPVVTTSRGSLV